MRSEKAFLLLILTFSISVISNGNSEGDALNALKTNLADPNNVLESWDPTLVNPCTWFHVTCDGNNSVIRVDLGNAGLSGQLVPQLGQLYNLQYLEIYGNNLSGSIPVELGNLTKLVSLDLYKNKFTGSIPIALGNLRSLRFMRLNSNILTGVLPYTIIQLITHGSLQILDVSDNHLAGTVKATKEIGFAITTVKQDPKAQLPA